MARYAEMAEQADKEGQVKSLVPKYKMMSAEGSEIIGKLLSWRSIKGKGTEGRYNQYTFETDEGNVSFHCGNHFDGTTGRLLGVGGVYRIVSLGKRKLESSPNSVNQFEVFELAAPPNGALSPGRGEMEGVAHA